MRHLTKLASLLAAITVLSWSTTARTQVYEQDFEFPDGTMDLGDGSVIATNAGNEEAAQVLGGRLRLTSDEIGSTTASYKIPPISDEPLESFLAIFEYSIFDTPGGNAPADGFAFSFGDIPGEGVHGSEEGFGGGFDHISFEFDTWNNGADEAGHNIAVNGVDVEGGFNELDPLTDGTTQTATIIYSQTGEDTGFATMQIDGEPIFEGVEVTGFTPQAGYGFAFSGRTGGATEDLFFDNLRIESPAPLDNADFNDDGTVDLADYEILKSNMNSPGRLPEGDINFSGAVDLLDFVTFARVFNEANAAAAVPEPSTWALAALGLLALCGLRARRK